MTALARPGRDGTVICGNPACGRTLPGAWRMNPDGWATAAPWLFLGYGWQWDEVGTWRVTARARRDAAFMTGRHGDARRHGTKASEQLLAQDGAEGHLVYNLPAIAVCPHCGSPLRLDPGRLTVDPSRHDGQERGVGRIALHRDRQD